MGIRTDVSAYLFQKSAPLTVRYGRPLRFEGTDLPSPRRISVPTRHGDVRCHVYRPRGASGDLPAYVHLHGGALLMRYPQMDDFWCRFVASQCDAVVINVDYDVAPQVRYPVAQEEAHDVVAWVSENGLGMRVDGNRVALGGFSAGGGLAAAATLMGRDAGTFKPVLQLLGVPSLDVAASPYAKSSPIGHPMITPGLLRLVRAAYYPDEERRTEPYASPLLAPDVSGLASALVVTAEYDVLRDEGDQYAARLIDAGVDVVHHVASGRDHYFLEGDKARARALMDLMAERLRQAFD